MKLGKPPVIEAWVEFRFAVDEDAPVWDETTAERFFQEQHANAFTIKDFVGHYEVEIEPRGGRPTIRQGAAVFERARATNADGDRYLQAGRDVLICNMLRRRGAWPQYRALRDEAMASFGTYVAFARVKGLRSVGLHYRDEVTVPFETSRIDLSDLLKVYPEVPETVFGPVSSFVMNLTLPEAAKSGMLSLVVRTVPTMRPATESKELRIALDWHLLSQDPPAMELTEVNAWLDLAHDDMTRVFRQCFSEAAWQRFDPKEE